jgi:predicted HTH transcriptional regulator
MLESFSKILGQNAEVITDFKYSIKEKSSTVCEDIEQSILQLLKRRPCTDQDITTALSLHSIETIKTIGHLMDDGKIQQRHQQGKIFYTIKPKLSDR